MTKKVSNPPARPAPPPAQLVELAQMASHEVMAACGINPVLFAPDRTGTGTREGYRQFLFGGYSATWTYC